MAWTKESKERMIATRRANKKARESEKVQGADQLRARVKLAINYLQQTTSAMPKNPTELSKKDHGILLALKALTEKS